jgi:lysophospholipase L1-like esterase
MINCSRLSFQFWGFTRILFFMGGFIMLKKFSTKASSFFIAVLMMVTTFSTTVEAAKPTGGGGVKNTAPVITLVGTVPALTEDTTTPGVITLSSTDKEGNPITWSIVSATLGTATLQPPSSTTSGTSTVKVNYLPYANKNGTAAVTVQAKDSLSAASKYTVSITVKPENDPPVNTTPPSISGTLAEVQTISAINGVWSDIETSAASLVFSYRWQLADDQNGTNSADIAGATTKAYTISSGYSGKNIRAVVTARDTGDNGTAPTSTTAYSSWFMISPPVPEAQYYVALGDSISAGTNNQNLLGNSYRYTNTFSSSLAGIFSGTSYSYKNDSVPGDDTDDLLLKLQTDSTTRSDVSKATIITISIGGNNLLSTASARGYSEINEAAATAGVNNFISDLPAIVAQINSLHTAGHLPQIYIMDMYNLFHPYERGWVTDSDGNRSEVFMNQFIYENYLSKMQAAIDTVTSQNSNAYRVNTYDAFENYTDRYTITNNSLVEQNAELGYYFFYSPYIEGTTVYSDILTRFDIYPFYPILFDYANIDKYRDPHPEEAGHNVLKAAHLSKFKEVNGLN